MKKFVKSVKALILGALMVSVLCVNAFAQTANPTVSYTRSFTFKAGSQYSTNYVSVRNYGPAYLTVYDQYGNTWELAPNYKVSIGVGRNQSRKIYMYPNRGSAKVYVATSEGSFSGL